MTIDSAQIESILFHQKQMDFSAKIIDFSIV